PVAATAATRPRAPSVVSTVATPVASLDHAAASVTSRVPPSAKTPSAVNARTAPCGTDAAPWTVTDCSTTGPQLRTAGRLRTPSRVGGIPGVAGATNDATRPEIVAAAKSSLAHDAVSETSAVAPSL